MSNDNDDIEMDDRLDKVMYIQDDVSAIRYVENNRRRNERNRLRRDEINHLQNERNRLNRVEVNLRQNVRRSVRQGRMYSIARSNAIPDYNYLGEMNQIYQHCSAKKFPDKTHFLCCHNGKVALPPFSPFTQVLQDLFTGNYVDRNANVNFLKHIRNYNACLSFASFKATVVQPINHGPPCFKICGQIYHRVGNLRMQQCGNDLCLRDLMFQLQTIIIEQSSFVLAFKNMAEVEDEEIRQAAIEGRQASVVKMSLLEGGDRCRYNLPSHDEVAVVFVEEDGAPPTSREVVIYPRGHSLKIVSSVSVNLDPMIYPLFFPRGDAGWHNQLVHNPERATLVRNHVTLSQFYNSRLSIRQFFCSLFYGKKLFQQYTVDAYVKIEGQHLAFIRNNQNKLRSEQYDALHEYVNNIANERNVTPWRVVILPSS
ncbi:uncharacterized protein LOC136074035 [Hydra vulgaris]|uniref:Uncharacterized protein LOC136074035 n=1 Tax=Hydra vulgaris TaxID=6087 RepID=A0ABM4B0W1_HYDVU